MSRTGENIYKRKDGRWEARYIISHDSNGKARYKYLYAQTYSDVKTKLLKSRSCDQYPIGSETDADDKKYEFWLNEWLKAKKVTVKESSYIRYRNIIENHIKPEIGRYPIGRIGTVTIEQFIAHKLQKGRLDNTGGLSHKSVSDILVIIKESFKFANSYGAYTVCRFEGISFKNKKCPREMRVLSVNEEQRLLSVLFDDIDRYKMGVFICLFTGIRIGELCALKWKNISLFEKTVKIEETMQRLQNENGDHIVKTRITLTEPKSYAALRTIPIPDFVTDTLAPFSGESEAYILSGKTDSFVEPRTMQNRFKSYLKEGKISDANFHSLRHTFATRCIEAGFDVKTLSEILGHSSVKLTLDKYVHSSLQLKRSNMEKLKPVLFNV